MWEKGEEWQRNTKGVVNVKEVNGEERKQRGNPGTGGGELLKRFQNEDEEEVKQLAYGKGSKQQNFKD